jgi:zinc protease
MFPRRRPQDPSTAALSVTRRRLSNGLDVVAVPRSGGGLVTVQLVVYAGSSFDPVGREGLADFVGSLLAADRRLLRLSGDRWVSVDEEGLTLGMTVSADALAQTLTVFAELMQRPDYPETEIVERRRDRRAELCATALLEPTALVRAAVLRLIYADNAYAAPCLGLPRGIRRVRRDDLLRFHDLNLRPRYALLCLVGDLDTERAVDRALRVFDPWNRGPARPRPRTAVPPVQRRVVLLAQAASGAAVSLARPAVAAADRDTPAARLAHRIYTTRLESELLTKRALVERLESVLTPHHGVGPLLVVARTRSESAANVASLLVAELDRLEQMAAPATEVGIAAGATARAIEDACESTRGIADLLGNRFASGDSLRWEEAPGAVSADAIRQVVARRLAARYASVVVAGDPARVLRPLQERFGRVLVIPMVRLNLASPQLL